MLERMLAADMAPFTGSLLLVAGLLAIELVMSLLGLSLMGDGPDGPEIDADFDANFDADLEADFDADAGATEAPDQIVPETGGIAAWLGFGEVPFVLWLAGLLTAFGLAGYAAQSIFHAFSGAMLPWWLVSAGVALPALRAGGSIARVLGRLVPKTETTAISRRSLGDRRGIIVQGIARRGRPAQAKVRDGHGNWHYLRVEPVDDDVEIPAGTEVMIRGGRGPVLLAFPID